MNTFVIILLVLAIISVAIMYVSMKNAPEVEDTPITPKFQPRKVVDLSAPSSINLSKKDVTPVSTEEALAPKKRYKRRNKKKKPAVAETAPTEKRSVGRPKKSN